MKIAADGTWSYLGSPIAREALARLFASVLRKDEDGVTYLVTPVEKVEIEVEDAPFLAVEMNVEEEGDARTIRFRTTMGDVVTLSREHPLRIVTDPLTHGFKPYILVRGRLEALIARALIADLVALADVAMVGGEAVLTLSSAGARFELGRMAHD